MSSRRSRVAAVVSAVGALVGCELREITLTEPERAVVAEAYVLVGPGSGGNTPIGPTPGAAVLLHETLDRNGGSGPVPGASVTITRAGDGLQILLQEAALGNCAITVPIESSGSCYQAFSASEIARLVPGDRLALRIVLADGRVLESETAVPGGFHLLSVVSGEECALPPGRQSGIVWSRSVGAWAYVSDAFVSGLGPILGSDRVDDPLYLLGVSVSALDTTISFPGEFGLFARAELDQGVSLTLQRGLPVGTSADVTVAAVDRNWLNWARGGNFNPSGLVRVPSVRGDGTGVFASAVPRSFRVLGVDADPQAPNTCPAEPED